MRGTIIASALAVCAIVPAGATSQAPAPEALRKWWQAHGQPPVDYVVSKFDRHDWVFLGEYHRIRDDLDLLIELIPAIHNRTPVRHLAVEFLCRTATATANELLTAPSHERRGIINFLRSQSPDWAYEEYIELFRTTWESNQVFGEERGPFRFVGLHPCIDWEVVNYSPDPAAVAAEIEAQDRYDEIMARELTENLLEPGLPALVYTGIAHSTARFVEHRYGTADQLLRMGNMVLREPWSDRMFFIALHAPFWDAGTGNDIYPFDGLLDRAMLAHRAPVGFDVAGSPVERLTHQRRSERSITAYEFGELYDGYIMHARPLKEAVGATCVSDWILTEDELRHFWRNLPNKAASERFSGVPLAEFRRDFCMPRPDHGLLFRNRFRRLPDLG
jgi:hypothetical protein